MADPANLIFEQHNADRTYYCCMIEIYKVELGDDPEMCFYIPLKEQR